MSSVTFSTSVGGDGSTVTDDNNATTGLRDGGWKTRFVPALTQEVAVAGFVVTKANEASVSATASAASATSAAASYDSFDDRYLGAKTTNPNVDNDGLTLLVGAIYWNTTSASMRVWSGSAWIDYNPAIAYLALTGGTLTGAIGIGSAPSVAVSSLEITKTMTGSATNVYGVANTAVVQSGVTTDAQYFNVAASTVASAFTLANMRGYYYRQSTIGAGSAVTSQSAFFVESDVTGATNNYGFHGHIPAGTGRYNLYMSGSANNYMAGNLGIGAVAASYQALAVSKNLTGFTSTIGVLSSGQIQSDSTTGSAYFVATSSTQATTFNTTYLELYGASQGAFGVGSTVTNQYAFTVGSSITGATNNYGFYGNIAAATGRYNLYMSGTANNYLAGSLGIGILPSSAVTLYINKAMTGATNVYGVANTAVVQSGVTTDAQYFNVAASTVASAFTLANMRGYYYRQSTIGAGSAVTSQSAFFVESDVTGATNNYGFHGHIPAGTGRYNLYMSGSADNYLAGNLGIGTSGLTDSRLHVRSDADALTVMALLQNRTVGANTGSVMAFITSANNIADNRYAYIGSVTSGTGQNGNNLVFASNVNGQAAVERMRIDNVGSVGIGTTANTSAILDAQSTTKGVRFPNMTTTQKTAVVTPAAGLVVFDTTLAKLCVYTGAAWQTITST